MIKLWEEAGKSLGARLAAASEPALVFWVWAIVVWLISHGGWSTFTATITPLFTDAGAPKLLAGAVAAVLVLMVSGIVVGRFATPILRLLEGYGPLWFRWLRSRRIRVWRAKLSDLEARSNDADADAALVTALDVELRRYPKDVDVMPTWIGNLMRAGERRPAYWYGLDPVVVWPQLWLVLPDQPRIEVTHARTQLDQAVIAFAWAVLSCTLGFMWWPALLIGIVVAVLIWRFWMPAAADTYATILSAVFDTCRFGLYDALHHPRPTNPASEHRDGENLTQLLWRGTGNQPITFTHNNGLHERTPQSNRKPPIDHT